MINLILKEHLPGFKFVTVRFAGSNARTYTYKTTLDLTDVEFVVVNAPSGLTVVTVVDPAAPVTEANYPIKWIVSAVDVTAYNRDNQVERDLAGVGVSRL